MKNLLTVVATFFLITNLNSLVAQQPSEARTEKQAREQAKKERKEFEKAQRDKYKFFVVKSDPFGAKVEVNGESFGVTPVVRAVTAKFFYNGPTFAFSSYFATPLTMTVSKEGYVSKTIEITKGPYQWVSINGANRLYFYVVSAPEFYVKLDKIDQFLGTNPFSKTSDAPNTPSPTAARKSALSTEDIVQSALPAVVTVKTPTASGSGFFILASGIIVTNKHVIGANESVTIVTSKGESFPSKSVYLHPYRDLALVKLSEGNFPVVPLADPSTVNIGSDVIAIGSPGVGGVSLQNTVTKGIISSFRKSETNGLLAQTDAALNHGNSGGPLLNSNGEVVGVNTLGFADFNKEGLNFAVFCSEILEMLKEQFNYVPHNGRQQITEPPAGIVSTPDRIAVQVTSEPTGADIFIDGKFVGSTPSKIAVSAGEHVIRVARPGYKDWERNVLVELGSSPNVNAVLETKPE